MTPGQRKQLADMAHAISHGKKHVHEMRIIGDVALVSGRSWRDSIKGLRMMQAENLLPDDLIDDTTAGLLEKMTTTTRKVIHRTDTEQSLPDATMLQHRDNLLAELLDRFDLVPRGVEFCAMCRPIMITFSEAKKKYFDDGLDF